MLLRASPPPDTDSSLPPDTGSSREEESKKKLWSNSLFPTSRMEVISVELDRDIIDYTPFDESCIEKVDIGGGVTVTLERHPSDIKGSCRILIGDIVNVREIYNPEKFKHVFTDLQPTQMLPPHSDGEYYDFQKCPDDYYDFQKSPKRKRVDSSSVHGHCNLPLTGPNLDLQPSRYGLFTLIVHQDTNNEDLLARNIDNYLVGQISDESVRSYAFTVVDEDRFRHDTPLQFIFHDEFYSLRLNCIMFKDSKLVTVSAKWLLMKEDDIGGGDNEKKKPNLLTETYIRGKLYFRSSAFNTTSVLLETPEDKVIKVVHGQPIPLLRSVVAVPYMSSFLVEASLVDPIDDNFDVEGSASFHQSEDNILYEFTDCIFGNGGVKIQLELTMKPNDLVRQYCKWFK